MWVGSVHIFVGSVAPSEEEGEWVVRVPQGGGDLE